jgi:hypothetical protein
MEMIDKIMTALKSEGFQPKMDDVSVTFKYQMIDYLHIKDEDNQYLNLYIPSIFQVDDDNRMVVMKTMNSINNLHKVVKLVLNDDQVWVCFEEKLPKDTEIDELLTFAIVILEQATRRFFEVLKEA